ncbi:RAMP superfamily CRISPR-associated protein [Mediterraneibacter sp.]
MNGILKRTVLYVKVRFISPLNVSSGENEWTDSDVLRDHEGNPFVTGSSLAGAMRAYIEKEKTEQCLMGFSKPAGRQNASDSGKMSSLFISDLNFDKGVTYGVRDNVALSDAKTAISQSKFDMEILEAGAKGHFYLELVIRAEDRATGREKEMEQELAKILQGIQAGEIRIGSKKTRGFGQFKIESIGEKNYTKDNYLEYADAYDEIRWRNCENVLKKWLDVNSWIPKMIQIEVPLRLKGGISIRQYAARKGEPDFTQLTDHGIPVVPGSSFTGAIRHRIKTILQELEKTGVILPKEHTEIIDIAFGYVDKKSACSSNIIINESEIKNAKELTMMRTGVSRLESAVKDGALYKEKTYVDGTLSLKAAVKKGKYPEDEKWIIGVLLLALKDLQNGFLAVGGQTAIGRGLFSADGPIRIDGKEGLEDTYIAETIKNMGMNGGGK